MTEEQIRQIVREEIAKAAPVIVGATSTAIQNRLTRLSSGGRFKVTSR